MSITCIKDKMAEGLIGEKDGNNLIKRIKGFPGDERGQ